jgi:hypothetical protein
MAPAMDLVARGAKDRLKPYLSQRNASRICGSRPSYRGINEIIPAAINNDPWYEAEGWETSPTVIFAKGEIQESTRTILDSRSRHSPLQATPYELAGNDNVCRVNLFRRRYYSSCGLMEGCDTFAAALRSARPSTRPPSLAPPLHEAFNYCLYFNQELSLPPQGFTPQTGE